MESDFQRMQREATQRLREMHERTKKEANHQAPAATSAPQKTFATPKKNDNPLNIFSSLFSGSGDGLLIAGVLFLLYRDKGDELLMLALLYSLM